jgi:hypothetical protein
MHLDFHLLSSPPCLCKWELLLFCLFAAVSALIQILYYLIYFKRVAFYQPPLSGHSQTQPVSVIICSRDEDKNLSAQPARCAGAGIQHHA